MLFIASIFLVNSVSAIDTQNNQVSLLCDGNCDDGAPAPPPPPPPPPPSGQVVPWGIARINAPAAAAAVDESGIKVAIIDTGLDYNHPDLAGKFLWGHSFYQGNTPANLACTTVNPAPCLDGNGHGTHVAGTIGALDNTFGVVGVAPQVNFYIFKGLDDSGSGSYSAIAQSITMATNGPDGIPGTADDADVISMSLGGPSGTVELQNAINHALAYNVVVVAATGNDAAPSPSYPAAYPGVIKVGAVDSSNAIAWFSNRGETILAPGVNVESTWLGGTYNTISGTSMATPHVAGVAALAWAKHPTFTGSQIRSLVEGAKDTFGIVDASKVVI